MRLICHPTRARLPVLTANELPVLLYGRCDVAEGASAGAAIADRIRRRGLSLPRRAWDLLSIALSISAADAGVERSVSPDGWTRELELVVGVHDPEFWNGQRDLIASMLRFLTTDIWEFSFVAGSFRPRAPRRRRMLDEESVMLLSGGMDSLIGALDLVANGVKPLAVSQTVLGDGQKQLAFAKGIGGGLTHLQLNHNADTPGNAERSQRARSFIFLTYGAIAAMTLRAAHRGESVPLYVCENGLIAINPPLTDARIGSLSTRTTHPTYLAKFQELVTNAGIPIAIENPYEFKTKGEMLVECRSQEYLRAHAHQSTSCGRFGRYGMRHCGRCVPCLIRRAAFRRWKRRDQTDYVFADLGLRDTDHSGFDDVRSLSMAIARMQADSVDTVLGTSLLSSAIDDVEPYRDVVQRGLAEVSRFLRGVGVR